MVKGAEIRQQLAIGRHALDRGRVCAVAELLVRQPLRLAALMECLWDEDPGVACRAADVLERVTGGREPGVGVSRLRPWKESLLGLRAEAEPKKLKWNLAFVVPRMELTVGEARRTARVLQAYLDDTSSIVKTAAMHGMADLTRHDASMRAEVVDLLRILSRSGTPAMRARGRILLKRFEKSGRGLRQISGD